MNRTVDSNHDQSSQGWQRPRFTVYTITALILFGVALAAIARPNSGGTPGMMAATTNGILNAPVFALWSALSSVWVWRWKPQWEWFAVASAPILVYAFFAAMVVVPNETSPLIPPVLHGGLWVVLVRIAWGRERGKGGENV